MAISGRKITDSDINTYGVKSAPDKLTGTASENKNVFDSLISNVVKAKLNGLIDDLSATTGGGEIGTTVTGVVATTVTSALAEIFGKVDTLDTNSLKKTSQSLTESEKAQVRDNIGIQSGSVAVNSVNGKTGAVTINKSDIFTELTQTLTAGQTQLTFINNAISPSADIEMLTDKWRFSPNQEPTVSLGTLVLNFNPQSENVSVRVRIS